MECFGSILYLPHCDKCDLLMDCGGVIDRGLGGVVVVWEEEQ